MKTSKTTITLRSILGLIFVVAPLATAFHLAPQPAMPPAAGAFVGALAATRYMLPLLWSTEIAAGVLLLSGVMAPLGLLLLAPIIVNIIAFHVFLSPGAMPGAIVVTMLELALAWQYRRSFEPLFRQAASEREHASNAIAPAVQRS